MTPTQTYKPKLLGEFIKNFEYYDCKNSAEGIICSSFLPLGTVQLLFQFGTEVNHKTAFNDDWEDRPNVFIGGPYDHAYKMKLIQSSEIFAVTFYPGMSKYFISTPICELKNMLVKPSDIWGKECDYISEKLCEDNSIQQRSSIIENFLLTKYRGIATSPIDDITTDIIRKNGLGKVGDYARLANLSESRFRKRFAIEVGVSPKIFKKIIRISALSSYYQNNSVSSLTSLACKFSYFDQSHFIREFKSITGISPNNYFRNERFVQF